MTITFGATATAASTAPHDLAVADDGQAFTVGYDDYRVEVDGCGPAIVAARWEWIVLPVADHPAGDPFTVAVRGRARTAHGAGATLLIGVNGIVDPRTFGPGVDGDFVRSVDMVTTGFDTQVRIAIGVIVDGAPGAAATVTVTAVDGNVRR